MESDIFSLLVNNVDAQTFNTEAPPNVEAPYVVFTVISEVYDDAFETESFAELVIQIDAYSLDKKESNRLIKQCIEAIKTLTPYDINFRYSKESDTSLWRATLECTIAQ